MPLIFNALIRLIHNWRAILAFGALILSMGFSGKIFIQQLGDSSAKFWWIGAMACAVLLGREFLKEYFYLKREQLIFRIKNEN